MRFDLTDLRLFIAVADAGSITHGAAEVGLALPSASERLRDMETIGEVKLLERGRRGVSLTAAGEALAHHARIVLRQMTDMHTDLFTHAKGMRSTVRVAANTASVTEYLPARLARFMADNPQIDVELKERQSAEIARSVSGGFVEIGILSDAVDTTGLVLLPFTIDRLVLITGPDHPLAARKSTCLADVLHEPFIGLYSGALYDHIEAHAARLGVKLKTRTRLRTFESICPMVAAGVGLAIIPELVAHRMMAATSIVRIPLTDAWATRHLSLCIRSLDELTSSARALIEHLSEERPLDSENFPTI